MIQIRKIQIKLVNIYYNICIHIIFSITKLHAHPSEHKISCYYTTTLYCVYIHYTVCDCEKRYIIFLV